MAVQLSFEEAQQTLKGISIPPRPALLMEIACELEKSFPNIKQIAAFIERDVGLSGAVLKVINSPFFGLRSKMGSVPQAIQMLGLKNINNLVTGLTLKSNLGGGLASLERFWDSAEKVATISAQIALLLPKVPRDEVYTFGLFRECGIPIMMQRFPDYRETLKTAAGLDQPMTMTEDAAHGTNHAVVGFMVAKMWCLPDTIAEAILRHHDASIFEEADSASALARTLVAINYLAEYLNESVLRMRNSAEWGPVEGIVLDHLGLTPSEFNELKDEVVNSLE